MSRRVLIAAILVLAAFCVINGYSQWRLVSYLGMHRVPPFERADPLVAPITAIVSQLMFAVTWFVGMVAITLAARLWHGDHPPVDFKVVAAIGGLSLAPAIVTSGVNMSLIIDAISATYVTPRALAEGLVKMGIVTIGFRVLGWIAAIFVMIALMKRRFRWSTGAATVIVALPQVSILILYGLLRIAMRGVMV